jgi:hypothetical protein
MATKGRDRKKSRRNPETPMVRVDTESSVAMENFRKIDEVESHRSIYEPLLKEMGYQHISYCHGAFERGKDFICLDRNRFGQLDLTVVQVKNSKITGDSTSSSSAIGIINQINRCLGTRVLNPATHTEQLPRKIILFTSYPIPDHALAGMNDELERLRRVCEIVEGSMILDLIKEYLPSVYAELAHPGHGLAAAVLRQLKVTSELSAVGVNRDRELPTFFVNIGVSSSRGRLAEIASGQKKLAPPRSRLHYPKNIFRAIESLATCVTDTLRQERLFSVIPSVPANRIASKTESDPLLTLSGRETVRRSRSRSLSEDVTVEVGDFDVVLTALESLRKTVEANQEKEIALFISYLYCLKKINIMLDLMDSKRRPKALGQAILSVGMKEHRTKYDLNIRKIDPSLLVGVRMSLALGGEAGAGKTSLSRIITKVAIERGLKCIYFPCSRIESKGDKLSDGLTDYLCFINALQNRKNVQALLESLDLIVIDGCDEAASFGSKKLSHEIRDLHYHRSMPVEYETAGSHDIFIPIDLQSSLQTRIVTPGKSDKTTMQIWQNEPIPDHDFDRMLGFDENKDFAHVIRKLQNGQRKSSVNIIVTSRNISPLRLSSDVAALDALPFDDEQLDQFFRQWFHTNEASYDRITEFLKNNSHIKAICRTPMIATLVAALEENKYDLPKSRTDIYRSRFDLLLEKWDRMRNVPSRVRLRAADKLLLLSRLALRIHKRNRSRFTLEDLGSVWLDGISELYPELRLDDLVWELQHSNGLIFHGGVEYDFGHLSYQEYLVAKEIVSRQDPKFLVDKFDDAWWRQVLLFYAGIAGNIDRLFAMLQARRPINRHNPLVVEMSAEARYSSVALKAFLN